MFTLCQQTGQNTISAVNDNCHKQDSYLVKTKAQKKERGPGDDITEDASLRMSQKDEQAFTRQEKQKEEGIPCRSR